MATVSRRITPLRYAAAWAVHAYTASGAIAGFLALQASFARQPRVAFLWMLIAVVIDATDGTLARAVEVKRVLPWFDGAKLDDIVDYFTFVIVPVAFLVQLELVPSAAPLLFAALPLLASGYGFCQVAAKTPDHFFTGFPSYWNILAFYLYVGGLPTWVNGLVIAVLSVFVFIPIRYIYPTRTIPFRRMTNVLGVGWIVVLVMMLEQLPTISGWFVLCSLYYPMYYTVLSFYLHMKATTPASA